MFNWLKKVLPASEKPGTPLLENPAKSSADKTGLLNESISYRKQGNELLAAGSDGSGGGVLSAGDFNARTPKASSTWDSY